MRGTDVSSPPERMPSRVEPSRPSKNPRSPAERAPSENSREEHGSPRRARRASRDRRRIVPDRRRRRSRPPWSGAVVVRKRFQVFNQVVLLLLGQAQGKDRFVVVDDVEQGRELAIVVEAPFRVRPEAAQRRGPVPVIRGAVRLEAVDPDLGRRMQVPAGVRPERLEVAGVALRLSREENVASGGRSRVEAPFRGSRGGNRELVELEGRQLSGDLVDRGP